MGLVREFFPRHVLRRIYAVVTSNPAANQNIFMDVVFNVSSSDGQELESGLLRRGPGVECPSCKNRSPIPASKGQACGGSTRRARLNAPQPLHR